MSYILPIFLLFAPAIVWAEDRPSMCAEISAVLQEAVRRGDLSYREAGSIMGNCFQVEEW